VPQAKAGTTTGFRVDGGKRLFDVRDGGSAGARTQDQYLKRVLLYQLSYRPGLLRGAGMVLLEFRNVHSLKRLRPGGGLWGGGIGRGKGRQVVTGG
jgi:hypothetical protein